MIFLDNIEDWDPQDFSLFLYIKTLEKYYPLKLWHVIEVINSLLKGHFFVKKPKDAIQKS